MHKCGVFTCLTYKRYYRSRKHNYTPKLIFYLLICRITHRVLNCLMINKTFYFLTIPQHWYDSRSWNHFYRKTRDRLTNTLYTVITDGLATQEPGIISRGNDLYSLVLILSTCIPTSPTKDKHITIAWIHSPPNIVNQVFTVNNSFLRESYGEQVTVL